MRKRLSVFVSVPPAVVTALAALLLVAACSSGRSAAEPVPAPTQVATATENPLPTPTAVAAVTAPVTASTGTTATTGVTATEPATATSPATATTAATTTAAAPIPDLAQVKVKLEPFVTGLDQPLFLTVAPGESGRMFVVEKVGRIRVVQDGKLVETPFLDITDKVSKGSEQGLLGLAFAPDYGQSGRFFVNYTDTNGNTHIARFQVSKDEPNRADPASETPILLIDQPAPNHNGGDVAFGPDGMLWIGMGDGGAANDVFGNSHSPDSLLAKMLRIDVTSDPSKPYTIPPDNPWVNKQLNGKNVRPEIWAIGLRNPWRWSFDRQTNDLWIADVGQNKIEEVDFVPAAKVKTGGLDFGWSIMEGKSCFREQNCDQTGLTLPVIDYTHEGGNCSVTGGYVYRGQQHPAWNGVYFYGDYCSGRMWALAPNGQGGWNNVELDRQQVNLSSFGQDAAGELYVTDLASGTVYRMTAP